MSKPIREILNFTGKTAVITGGSSGIGAGIVRRYAETGANVVFSYLHNGSKAKDLVAEIERAGRKAVAFQLDTANSEQCISFIQKAADHFGSVDMLVNNAGIYPAYPLLDIKEQEWDYMMNSNLRGAFFCAQAAAAQMIKQGNGGTIVNISSINGYRPMMNSLVYGVSKAGIDMVTRCMAVELGKYGIRVNAVAPGLMDNPDLDKNVPGWREAYSSRAPIGRIGLHSDIADVCIFYSSDLSAWITGEVTMVDGGVMHAAAY